MMLRSGSGDSNPAPTPRVSPDPDPSETAVVLILVPTYVEAHSLFGERAPRSERPVPLAVGSHAVQAALCGFGLAAAGVLAQRALEATGARSCLLVGMAGSYDLDRLPVGGVLTATEVHLEGIGRGRGAAFRGPVAMGFDPVPADGELPAIGERLPLPALVDGPIAGTTGGGLVSVASCSASFAEASELHARHPEALAEDMEAFSVAVACARARVSLTVLRGVSNAVGEPDRDRWERDRAMKALAVVLAGALPA